MNIPDYVTMLHNVSQSLIPVQIMFRGLSYVLGLVFVVTALVKLYLKSSQMGGGGSHEKSLGPFAYLLAGAFMLLLPQANQILGQTAFGVGNVLSYDPNQPSPNIIVTSILVFIKAAGVLWFIRGCVLLAHASAPGDIKDCTKKGLLFLTAGILSINAENTAMAMHGILMKLVHLWGSAPT